ncbi:J domain-containing protein [Chitinophaga sedimenti]|uniref:J domain-containing protein n=1 Tax=Chitinophaga sedimenti TaxID=2033606 RepID=UPI002006A5B0|nr:J domain-containing protein [Chitinophaga sedimenti]MCK7554965.1 J domain-containing protein [Chitinophaga sedimenti]
MLQNPELPDFAGADQIKAAYRRLAKRYHPDVNGGDKRLDELFKQVQHAYDILTDPYTKSAHDNRLRYVPPTTAYIPPQPAAKPQAPAYDYRAERRFRWQAGAVLAAILFPVIALIIATNQDETPEYNIALLTVYDQPGGAGRQVTLDEFLAEQLNKTQPGYEPPRNAFKLGDTFDSVLMKLGPPTSMLENASGETLLKYGATSITLHDGRVWEYAHLGDSLNFAYTTYDREKTASTHFAAGATRSVVLQLQGKPLIVRRTDVEGGEIWVYPGATVSFADDRVVGFANDDGSLRVTE